MASDITLAVGGGASHMTYDELAQAHGISLAAAPIVPRPIPRNSAETADFSEAGPVEAVSYETRPMLAADGLEPASGAEPTPAADVPEANPLTAIAIQTLSQAVEMLREDVGHERDRADQAERRIDELLHDLADARTAAMITGCEAAALRSRLENLTDQRARPWWRRWLR